MFRCAGGATAGQRDTQIPDNIEKGLVACGFERF